MLEALVQQKRISISGVKLPSLNISGEFPEDDVKAAFFVTRCAKLRSNTEFATKIESYRYSSND